MTAIRWEEDALADLVNLRKYIAQNNATATFKIAHRILAQVDLLLVDQPFRGAPGRIHTTRELVVTNTQYTVVYHVDADTISILRVFHQAQQWPVKS